MTVIVVPACDAGDVDLSFVLVDDRVTDREAEPVPLPTGIVVKKGSKTFPG